MSKFKVGDRVKVVAKTYGVPESAVPSFGSVENIRESYGGPIVTVLHDLQYKGSSRWEHYEANIEFELQEANLETFSKISPHYTADSTGKDYLQRFFENSAPEEVKGAMVFTIGKYIDRLGKKDAPEKELAKIIDYATRYRDFLNK